MKSISSLRSQSRLFYLLVIASLLIQMGFTTPVQAAAVPAPQASVQSATFTTCTDVTEIPLAECEALVALYNSTGGANWTNNDGWLETNTPCSWFGIECVPDYIYGVKLTANNLTGTIPEELGNLSNIEDLELDYNQLTGSIPSELGNLVNLVTLELADNQFDAGEIPSWVSNLDKLRSLGLNSTRRTGVIPPWLFDLVNLEVLGIDHNQLSGPIPADISKLTNLIMLNLSGNQLTGTIPSEIGNISSLVDLNFGGNNFSGTIPPEFGNLTNLRYLDFGGDGLVGNIPTELGNLVNLELLELGSNQLTGSIPPELDNLVNLQALYLANNQLTGPIPLEIGNLTNLQEFGLANNQLSGQIPTEIGNLSSLTYLDLPGNQLTGSIPPGFGNLSNLTYLDLDSNQLTGSIPPELGNLVNLTMLRLNDNQLTGEIPVELANLVNLQGLGLSRNQLSGQIPPEIGNLTNLQEFGLANNQLSGQIPTETSNLSSLTYLDLPGNQFTGNLPSSIGNLTSLTVLYTGDNELSGEIPSSITSLTGLTALTLSCGLTSTDPFVIAFLDEKLPGWQNRCTPAYNPSIAADVNQDAVALWGWTPGSELSLTIDAAANGTGVDYTTSMIMEGSDGAFYVEDAFDIQVGDIITVTDGITTRQVTVTFVRILGVNLDTNTVYGEADPSDTIGVGAYGYQNCDWQGPDTTADQNGNWVADFTGICNLTSVTTIGASKTDENSGTTRFFMDLPTFTVYPQNNLVNTIKWLVGNEVTLIIDSAANGSVDYTDTKTTDGYHFYTSIDFDLGAFETHPGDLVTMTDGITTKTTVVANLTLGGGNVINDSVWGTADPGEIIRVLHQYDYNTFRNVTADAQGNWMADFSVPGDEPGEDGLFDIRPENVMLVNQKDQDGDQTQLEWHAPNPIITANLADNSVQGIGWALGEVVTLKLHDPSTPSSSDIIMTDTSHVDTWNSSITEYDLYGKIDLKPGFVLTMTDGNMTKTLTLVNLRVNAVDPATYIVSGITPVGMQVEVNATDNDIIKNRAKRHTIAGPDGHWSVNFSVVGTLPDEQTTVDLMGGSCGSAIVSDADGDSTSTAWRTISIDAIPDDNWVWTDNWPLDALLTMRISGPGLDYSAQATVGYSPDTADKSSDLTRALFDLPVMLNPRLQAGDIITITDGITTKSYTVAPLQVTNIDVDADTISGIAPPGALVDIYDAPESPGGSAGRWVTADATGHWLANFHIPDVPPDDKTSDLQAGSFGQGRVYDDDGNATWVEWRVPNPQFDVRANFDQVEAFQWALGDTLTVTIDSPSTSQNPDYAATQTVTDVAPWDPNQTYLPFYLAGLYDIQVGDQVSVSNGSITKTTVVTNLAMTTFNVDADTVNGIAAPGSHVDLWACGESNCINRHVNADQNGNWSADFAHPGIEGDEQDTFDIVLGTWVDSQQTDEDSDQTMYGVNVPANHPPVADAGGPYTVYASDTVTLDASASSDPDGDPLTYEWDLDNDGQYDDASGVTTTTSFNQIGDHAIGLRVTDAGGLSDTDTATVTVLPWTLKGFYQPVDMNGVYNIVKNGNTVPFKFEIFAGSTELTDTTYIKSLTYAQTSCDANATTDEIETTVTGGTSLRYDTTSGQFIYNWKTPKMPGKCYRVTITALDGTSLLAYFKLK